MNNLQDPKRCNAIEAFPDFHFCTNPVSPVEFFCSHHEEVSSNTKNDVCIIKIKGKAGFCFQSL